MVIAVDPESIEIIEDVHEDKKGRTYTLLVGRCRRATCRVDRNGVVTIALEFAGQLQWIETRVILQGLLELSIIADRHQVAWENKTNGSRRKKVDD